MPRSGSDEEIPTPGRRLEHTDDAPACTPYPRRAGRRLAAIEQELNEHCAPGTRWIAINDACIDSPNAVRTDPCEGVTLKVYYRACELLGSPDTTRCLSEGRTR